MDENTKRMLEKQRYKVVGEHSGVKVCHWTGESLLRDRKCYKSDFYGVDSHRCLQMTPTVDFCNSACLFCWRFHGWGKSGLSNPDDPSLIVEESFKAQIKLISGYKGDERCPADKWAEAANPKHVAISLSGEPTFYPRLGELIEEYHKKGLSTFLVTNGTTPKVLVNLDPLPTQLYITVAAPNEDIYKKLAVPHAQGSWEKLQESLDIMRGLDCRTVIRHTLVDGWNIGYEDEYARMINKAQPQFVEPKGYVFVGYSRTRLHMDNMPSHDKVLQFSRTLCEKTGYEYLSERSDSRVVLLGHKENWTGLDGNMKRPE